MSDILRLGFDGPEDLEKTKAIRESIVKQLIILIII